MESHKKLCWSCDGYVHIYELKCPYCGAELSEHQDRLVERSEKKEPPKVITEDPFEGEIPESPFQDLIEDTDTLPPNQESSELVEKTKVSGDVENPLSSILLLYPGTLFLIFGLALFIFSKNGQLTFSFSAKYRYLYMLLSWPLLYFGYKSLYPSKQEKKTINSGLETKLSQSSLDG